MIVPAVHDLAMEYEGKLNVAKLDVDSTPGHRRALRHQEHTGTDLLQERSASASSCEHQAEGDSFPVIRRPRQPGGSRP